MMSTPDVTAVQMLGAAALALTGAIFGVLAAFGHALTADQTIAISGLVTAFVSVAVIADSIIRNGRARIAAAKAAKPAAATPRTTRTTAK